MWAWLELFLILIRTGALIVKGGVEINQSGKSAFFKKKKEKYKRRQNEFMTFRMISRVNPKERKVMLEAMEKSRRRKKLRGKEKDKHGSSGEEGYSFTQMNIISSIFFLVQ
ncbi:hypothetical protein P8452_71571 [Trifolium repens]|nr:hypothetical protein P8452_71571 [Trifolium repens]